MTTWTTKQAAQLFEVASPQTIRNWAKEFEEYLSPTARPSDGDSYLFTEEDMMVLGLVAALRNEGKKAGDIHAALRAGQRGLAPLYAPQLVEGWMTALEDRGLALQVQDLKRTIQTLILEREKLETQVARSQADHEENIRLHAQLEMIQQQLNDMRERLQEEYQRGLKAGRDQEKLESLQEEIKRLRDNKSL